MRLKKIFGEVLSKDINEIGENDNFFLELGGTSLDYMSLIMKIEQEFETRVVFDKNSYSSVKEFYEYLISKEN